ncbi:MAG: ABC transporter ATP-binding protein, partial [Kiritimatiellaeota bacterium]|nr:ABC transporter ATP-binding protein [Kiritimatiellota bacterium]
DIHAGWPGRKPIIDCIAPGGDFNAVTGALAAVGLGDVPAWLRPFRRLSNGERFRAGLARLVAEAPPFAVVDEFTSVIDRQIARVGSLAFGKAWRRTGGKCVLLSCHYDIIDWLQPDWVYDTTKGEFAGRSLRRPPPIALDIHRTGGAWWPLFEPHHYLKIPRMIAARYYVGFAGGQPVCHVAVSPRLEIGAMRACRLVVMPEWQGAGLGVRFLDEVCRLTMAGGHGFGARVWRGVYFHTSHPGLAAALRRASAWRQASASLCGGNKAKSRASIVRSLANAGGSARVPATGYGGHFRAVQGFLYEGHKDAQA